MSQKWDGVCTFLTVLASVFLIMLGSAIVSNHGERVEAMEKIAAQKATIADLREENAALEGTLEATENDLADCQDEAAAWQNAGAAMITGFQLYLDGFPLDLGESIRYADDAHTIDCI